MSVFVKGPGNVKHNGVFYEVGEEIKDLAEHEANALLKADAVQTTPVENGRSELVVPTDEEVANAVKDLEVK